MALEIRLYGNNNWLSNSGYTKEFEEQIYLDQLEDVYCNPRWYLDNLDYIVAYRVSWKNYKYNTPTIPYSMRKRVKKQKPL